jgi:hypothetical protein
MPIVRGYKSAIAMLDVKPGKAPTNTPMTTAEKIKKMFIGSRISVNPLMTGAHSMEI